MSHSLPAWRFCVAPMMEWTDRHCRYLMRLLTRHALLYTEMVTAPALIHGRRHYLLAYDNHEQPVALQLGGSDPTQLAQATRYGVDAGYCEINLNCGCPSDRVQSGRFGACLMAEPTLVADCLRAMQDAAGNVPVTIKTRIGIDDQDSYDFLRDFVGTLADAGCERFIIHARKALLQGLSPKENREIPPLDYQRAVQLKQDFPALTLILNGGLTVASGTAHMAALDGVMVGRAAYHDMYSLADVDRLYFHHDDDGDGHAVASREAIVEAFIPYIEAELAKGTALKHITRHMLGLYNAVPGARLFRRELTEHAHKPGAGIDVLHRAVQRATQQATITSAEAE